MNGDPCIELDVDECSTTIISAEFRVARKEHKCCECHKPIRRGIPYYYEFTKSPDGELLAYKTCMICKDLRDNLFRGWMWGSLWEDIENFVEEDPSRSILDCSIGKLSRPALDAYLDVVKKHS